MLEFGFRVCMMDPSPSSAELGAGTLCLQENWTNCSAKHVQRHRSIYSGLELAYRKAMVAPPTSSIQSLATLFIVMGPVFTSVAAAMMSLNLQDPAVSCDTFPDSKKTLRSDLQYPAAEQETTPSKKAVCFGVPNLQAPFYAKN